MQNSVVDKGTGNKIIVGNGSCIHGCNISFWGSNCTLEIKPNTHLNGVSFWFEDVGGFISIGTNTTMESGCQFASVEGTKIIVGDDCMFSHDVDVRTTDSHSILNYKGERINPSEDIFIGNHVWIGIRSTLLKGCMLHNNSVVASCSVVTSKTMSQENTIVAGVPAKVIKSEINWKRERI